MPLKPLYVVVDEPGPDQHFIEIEDEHGASVAMSQEPYPPEIEGTVFAGNYRRIGPFVALGDRLRVLKPRDPEQPPITELEYVEAIRALLDGKTQLWPDGKNCAVCTDDGHQAFECRFNPVVLARSFQLVEDRAHELHEQLHHLLGI